MREVHVVGDGGEKSSSIRAAEEAKVERRDGKSVIGVFVGVHVHVTTSVISLSTCSSVESVVDCAMSVYLYGPKVKFCTKLTAPSSASWTASRCAEPVMLTEMSTTRYLQFLSPSRALEYGRDSTRL